MFSINKSVWKAVLSSFLRATETQKATGFSTKNMINGAAINNWIWLDDVPNLFETLSDLINCFEKVWHWKLILSKYCIYCYRFISSLTPLFVIGSINYNIWEFSISHPVYPFINSAPSPFTKFCIRTALVLSTR